MQKWHKRYTFFILIGIISSNFIFLSPCYAWGSKTTDDQSTTATSGFVSGIEQRVINFVHKTVNSVRYTAYKLGGSHFDTSKGIYVLDCSTYIDNILETVHPGAYNNLMNSSGSDKPTTKEYYNFFSRLKEDNDYWNKIDNVKELRPGDVLVFRNKGRDSGHVMLVMNQPVKENNSYVVRVADSAPVGHSEDTRSSHDSGIGIGTLQLKVNPKTGEPSAYAWKVGSCWKKNVKFAMARPYDSETA